MLETRIFGAELKNLGFDFYSGVPCSHLQYLINYAINDCDYVMAANEGDAVAICAGAHLGGKKTVFLCQNSGLTNATSPLTSLNYIFKIPVLGFVSLRGEPGIADEPQHELMGEITEKMLSLMKIDWAYLATDMTSAREQIKQANVVIAENKPFFFVVKKDTFAKENLNPATPKVSANQQLLTRSKTDLMPTRLEALAVINGLKDENTVCFATTGKTGRELCEVEDAPNYLYMVGSMGCVSSLALGLSLVKSDKNVIAVEGDGALLMRLGSLTTNAYYAPKNMLHIVLDNNTHDSTGGQLTVSHNIDFVTLAASVGYTRAIYAHGLDDLKEHILDFKQNGGLTFLYLKIAKGSKPDLGRPKVKPQQVKERFIKFLST